MSVHVHINPNPRSAASSAVYSVTDNAYAYNHKAYYKGMDACGYIAVGNSTFGERVYTAHSAAEHTGNKAYGACAEFFNAADKTQ